MVESRASAPASAGQCAFEHLARPSQAGRVAVDQAGCDVAPKRRQRAQPLEVADGVGHLEQTGGVGPEDRGEVGAKRKQPRPQVRAGRVVAAHGVEFTVQQAMGRALLPDEHRLVDLAELEQHLGRAPVAPGPIGGRFTEQDGVGQRDVGERRRQRDLVAFELPVARGELGQSLRHFVAHRRVLHAARAATRFHTEPASRIRLPPRIARRLSSV